MSFIKAGLLFREVENSDLSLLRTWRNKPDMAQYWNDPRSVQTDIEQARWYQNLNAENQAYLVEDAAQVVGLLRFRLDYSHRRAALTGTDVAPDRQGQGYGKRILRAGIEYIL